MKTLFAQTLRVNCGFVLLACGLIVCPRLEAGGNFPSTLLNVDFGPLIGESLKAGPAATGQTNSDFWNYYSRDDGHGGYRTRGGLANMVWANGEVSTVGMNIANAPGCWGNGAADPMYEYYLYPLGGASRNITVVVTNLPAGSYDFYLYGHGNADNQSGVFQLSSCAVNYGTQATASSGNEWQSPVWRLGRQYVLFTNVTVAADVPVTITVLPDPAGYAIIAGMQIALNGPEFLAGSSGAAPVMTSQPASQAVAVVEW